MRFGRAPPGWRLRTSLRNKWLISLSDRLESMVWSFTRRSNLPTEAGRPRSALVDFDHVVQFSELIDLNIFVVRIGHPFAVHHEAVTISSRLQGEAGPEFAGLAAIDHWGGHRGPVVEIAGDQDFLGLIEAGGEDDLVADLFRAVEFFDLLSCGLGVGNGWMTISI